MDGKREDRREETAPVPDPGLKRLLTYTFIALVLSVIAAFIAMSLAVYWFDR